jgi:hypothetical protein
LFLRKLDIEGPIWDLSSAGVGGGG